MEIKSITRDYEKLKSDLDSAKGTITELERKLDKKKEKYCEIDQQHAKLSLKHQELEHKLQRTENSYKETILEMEKGFADKEMKIVLDNVNKVQDLESLIEKKEKEIYE